MKKNKIRGFFSGEKGQRTFNYAYSIGASIVILGALFKLLHLPGADLILIIGMGTEATIFFLSAFDEPAKDYKWERVYPELGPSEEEVELAEKQPRRRMEGAGGGTVIIGGGAPLNGGTVVVGCGGVAAPVPAEVAASGSEGPAVPVSAVGGVVSGGVVSGGVAGGLSTEQASALEKATDDYVKQLNEVTAQLGKLKEITSALSGGETSGYAEQMQSLSKNIQGLNTIYEIQLKSVSQQLDTIERVNAGLNQIRSLYENGTNDSFRIRQETEHMTSTLAQLNVIYERMLQAMTANIGYQQPQQPYVQPQQFAAQAQYPQQGTQYPPQSQNTQFPQKP